jgi:outer membrane protein assembly factor BamA
MVMGKKILSGIAILIVLVCPGAQADETAQDSGGEKTISWSVFPIIMYDTDIGLGYGGKGKIVNLLKLRESFDLFLFNSTKGERSYELIFSIPDVELRQGTVYGLSFDLKAAYNKFLNQYYYGIGPDSSKDDLTHFTDEKKELLLTLGRGFSPNFVAQIQYAFKNVHYFNVEEHKPLTDELLSVGEQYSPYAAALLRYDTSDSQIHPTLGVRLILKGEFAGSWMGNGSASYFRYGLDLRGYTLFLSGRNVLALRGLVQKISGEVIPLFELPDLGGMGEFSALRGYQFNRFRDKGKILFNAEYRFHIWKRLGGNVFVDAGSVWPEWNKIRMDKFAATAGWGLRYYMREFLVRFDMGISPEGIGIYFNFNHVF